MISLFVALQLAAVSPTGNPPSNAGAASCGAQPAPAKSPFAGNVMFVCGSRVVSLGKADDYRSSYNSTTRSTAVVLKTAENTRVLLISPTSNDLQVEDVTIDLAKLAGRYFEAGIDGLDVDLAKFASDGMLVLNDSASPSAAAARAARNLPALGAARRFDAKPYAARAAAQTTGAMRAGGEQ